MSFRHGDASDSYANSYNHIIVFTHIATGLTSRFKAFVTSFSDQYQSRWNDVDVFGRMDPITTFQGTKREINFSFDVVANSSREALRNLEHSRRLIQSLYPVYDDIGGAGRAFSATSIQAPPLLKLKFSNLITNHDGQGLVGKLDGINYVPDFEPGVFERNGRILPKVNKFDCTFTVLHTVALGFNSQGAYRGRSGQKYPYYMSTGGEANPGPDPSNQETEGAEETTAEQGTPAEETAEGQETTAEGETYPTDGTAADEVTAAEEDRDAEIVLTTGAGVPITDAGLGDLSPPGTTDYPESPE